MTLKKIIFPLIMSTFFVLTACGESVDTQIYNHLEEAVSLEKGFEDQQTAINNLEKKEQEIYEKIIELGMDDFDTIKELSVEATTVIDERADKIEIEKNSIDESRVEFEKAESLINEIDDETVKDKAENMYEVMMERYDAYGILYEAYINSLNLERELYEMLQKDEMDQETLTAHIDKINESYQVVIEANETFNTYTSDYNQLKKEYYDVADINVTYDNKN
ncbi:YkyA family protein [Ornithinibacillus salinisoli]|uniref:YkyA family protein n=1 Tax=Ornithinibacillus salinisoli TaxID=1848459 RepID=A0ABW4VZE2_9BACI